jgi:hypothetical protein
LAGLQGRSGGRAGLLVLVELVGTGGHVELAAAEDHGRSAARFFDRECRAPQAEAHAAILAMHAMSHHEDLLAGGQDAQREARETGAGQFVHFGAWFCVTHDAVGERSHPFPLPRKSIQNRSKIDPRTG